ncbi:hypothetical protein [Methanogenium cariaci]|nr:hypothetical protein [Methanogenium cariaci]
MSGMNRPEWGGNACTFCFACINYCPPDMPYSREQRLPHGTGTITRM